MSDFWKLLEQYFAEQDELTEDGGAGSGNFGHKGRPGEVGGSGKGGGKQHRVRLPSGGYVGYDKVKSFRMAKSVARDSKDYDSFREAFENPRNIKLNYALSRQFCDVNGYEYKEIVEYAKDKSAVEVAEEHPEELDSYLKNWYSMMHDTKPVRRGNKPVDGKDISKQFTPVKRHELAGYVVGAGIDQIVDLQGFNGVPKLVSSSEFDRILERNPQMPLMMRSYNAKSKEVLQAYDKELESGEWYVDCTKGGSLWGAGMYTGAVTHAEDAVDENGKPYRALIDEMYAYRGQNILSRRFGTSNVDSEHATRRMTMMSDAKIIDQRDLAIMALEAEESRDASPRVCF